MASSTMGLAALANTMLGPEAVGGETRRKLYPVILVWLEGAASPWETFMPHKPDAIEEFKGKDYAPIDTSITGIQLGNVLPDVALLLNQGTLIRSLDSVTHDHFKSTQSLLLEDNKPDNKTLGLVLGEQTVNGGVPYTVLNMPGQYSADTSTIRDQQFTKGFTHLYNPRTGRFPKPDTKKDPRFDDRKKLLSAFDTAHIETKGVEAHDKAYDTAFGLLGGDCKYFDALSLDDELVEKFGPRKETRTFGERTVNVQNPLACAAAAAHFMVTKGGAGFVTIHHCERNGWDMHVNMPQEMEILGGHLNLALAELIRRSREDGYIVLCTSEMGRTPKLNGAKSRDHYNVHFAFGAGGKFAKGLVIGDYDAKGKITKDRILNVDLFPTVLAAAGVEVNPRIRRVREATP